MEKLLVQIKKEGRKKKYDLLFQYNLQLINTIKSIEDESKEYDGKKKCWRLSTRGLFLLICKFKGLDTIFFDFGGEENKKKFLIDLEKVKQKDKEDQIKFAQHQKNKIEWVEFKEYLETNFNEYSELVHQKLNPNINLFPHQIKGVMFCHKVRNVLLAHQMGLGKTLVSISFSELNNFEKVFVITPNSLKFNYFNEVSKFTNSKAYIYNSKNNKYKPEECKYIIVNYDMLNPHDIKKVMAKLKELKIDNIDCVILDECQKIKNSKTNIYKNFSKIFTEDIFKDKKVCKIFMSGTPAPNRAYELYNVLHEISPFDFKNKNGFYQDYCGMTYNPETFGGWDYNIDDTNYELLFNKMKPFVDRRRKIDVLDLPEKTYQKILIELSSTEEKEYAQIRTGVIKELLKAKTLNPLTVIIRLKQYLCNLKSEKIKDIIDSALESGDKIVIIDTFKDSLRELKTIYGGISGLHTGDQSVEERNDIVTDFQNPNGKYKIFLGTVATCNYGLTLTAANKMIVLMPPDSLGEFDQVTDRIHRIGQKYNVLIMCPVFLNTLDEKIYDKLDEKRTELSTVIDGEAYTLEYSHSVLNDIISEMVKGNI